MPLKVLTLYLNFRILTNIFLSLLKQFDHFACFSSSVVHFDRHSRFSSQLIAYLVRRIALVRVRSSVLIRLTGITKMFSF